MANLYYNAAVDAAWDTLGNWWNDALFTDPATALPANGDTVYVSYIMTSGPSTSVTLAHIYSSDAVVNFTGAVGDATFNGNSYFYGTLTGDATFNDSSQSDGTVTGDATFNGSSYNNGTVSGTATYNGLTGYSYQFNTDYIGGLNTQGSLDYEGIGYFNGQFYFNGKTLPTDGILRVRTTGDDSTGNGSTQFPFASANSAFWAAYASNSGGPPMPWTIDLGEGNFGGVGGRFNNSYGYWDIVISVVGIPNASVLGDINLPARFTNLTLTDVQAGSITSNNGHYYTYLTLVRSDVGSIYLDGGWSGGSSATLTDSSAGNIYVSSTQYFESITLTNSTAADLEVRGRGQISVTLTNSTSSNIISYSEYANNPVTLTDSTAGDIAVSAYSPWQCSGPVYLNGTSSAGTITGNGWTWYYGNPLTGWGVNFGLWPAYFINGVQHYGLNEYGNGVSGFDGYKYINANRVVDLSSLPTANQVLSGVAYGEGMMGTHTEATIPKAPQAWGNFTYYAQGDVVSEGGFLWILASTGGWTVGGRPSLGYGWQKLSTGGGASAPQPINLAQLIGLPPFIQL